MEKRSRTGLFVAGWLTAVLLLGLWHLTDVSAGVKQSGETWLYGWYGVLFAFGLLLLAAMAYQMYFCRVQKFERWFAAAVLGLGLLYMVILPPLSAPDEVSHYISAYELSNRFMGKAVKNEKGLIVIRAEDAWIEDLDDVLADDGSGKKKEGDTARILGQELSQETYQSLHEAEQFSEGEQTAVSYQPDVRTTPLAYAVPALGFTLARLLGLGSLGLLYLGRLFNLLFFTAMGVFAIRKLPFGKEVYFGVCLLPMSLHLVSSLSYDTFILALSGYFIAVCLYLAYEAGEVRKKDVAVLALTLGAMGPCKMVYGAIAGFCLLIPVRKFGGIKKWLVSAVIVLGAFVFAMAVVNLGNIAMYTQAEEGYVAWAGETGYTFAELLHRPFHVIKLCYDTLAWQGEPLFAGMIGDALGNRDMVLNTPYMVVLIFAAILVVLALKKPGERDELSVKNRLWIWCICLGILGALMFSMLLAWTPRSANTIQGVQGRYLLPLLPVFLLTLKNQRVVRTGDDDRGILYGAMALNVYVILRIFAVVCLRV